MSYCNEQWQQLQPMQFVRVWWLLQCDWLGQPMRLTARLPWHWLLWQRWQQSLDEYTFTFIHSIIIHLIAQQATPLRYAMQCKARPGQSVESNPGLCRWPFAQLTWPCSIDRKKMSQMKYEVYGGGGRCHHHTTTMLN